jgi:hypothetical protein
VNRANILNCASIAYIGIAAPLMLDGFMQQVCMHDREWAMMIQEDLPIKLGSWLKLIANNY